MNEIPNIRRLLKGIGVEASSRWPGIVTELDVRRVDSAEDQLLVLTRVLFTLAKRAGVPKERIDEIVAEASAPPELDPSKVFEPARTPAAPDGQSHGPSVWDTVWDIDNCLSDPRRAGRVPGWFTSDFWPGVTRRMAAGKRPSDHELGIMRMVAGMARGE